MRFLYGLVTLIAALAVIVFAGSWIAEKYGTVSGLGLVNKPRSYVTGVPATEPLEVSTDLDRVLLESGWDTADGDPMFLPVYAGRQSGGHNIFWSSSGSIDTRWQMGGGCRTGFSGPAVNFVRWDPKSATLNTFFETRVLLSLYGTYESPKGDYLVALVVRRDTDGSEYLTCRDQAHFEIISLDSGERKIIEKEFIPEQIAWHGIVGNGESLGFTETSTTEETPYLQLYELNLLSGELTERDELKVLSEAAIAVNKIEDGREPN